MDWSLKSTKRKVHKVYKSLYLSSELLEKINLVAKNNGTSANNVIISMIESCLNHNDNSNNSSDNKNPE